jgi:hypothetical protein
MAMQKKRKAGEERVARLTKEVLKACLLILCIYATTEYAHPPESNELTKRMAGANHIYLTHLGLYMTIMTLLLSYSVRHLGLGNLKEVYRDSLSLAIPLEGFVVTAFWALHLIDPTLLRNKELYYAGVRTPFVTEISLHLLPFILLLIDQSDVNLYHKRTHYMLLMGGAAGYFFVSYYFFLLNKCWAYPFLDDMPMALRMVVLTGLTAIVILYYKLFLKLSRLKNSNIHI